MRVVVALSLVVVSAAANLRGLIPDLFGGEELSGSYTGSVTVLGETVTGHIVINSETSADLTLTGPMTISCEDEAYTLDGSTITLDDVDVDGDCVHDALEEYDVTLNSVTYDDTNDQITIDITYFRMSINIVLTHDATVKFQDLATAMLRRSELGASPSGVYVGKKSILGLSITAEMDVDVANVDMKISGPISLECDAEPYTLDGDDFDLTDKDQAGDCVHDDLAEENVTLKSITYDAASDSLDVKVKYSKLSITITLDHTSSSSKKKKHHSSSSSSPKEMVF